MEVEGHRGMTANGSQSYEKVKTFKYSIRGEI